MTDMTTCDFGRLITMYETGGLDKAMKSHLTHCSDCQQRLHNFLALTSAMMMAEPNTAENHAKEDISALPDVSLPDELQTMVEERKTRWQQRQLGKVLQFRDPDKKKDLHKKIIDRLTGEHPVDLPKAAFPDDLDDENET